MRRHRSYQATDIEVRAAAKRAGRTTVIEQNLILKVSEHGNARWELPYMLERRPHVLGLGLGKFPYVTLAQARADKNKWMAYVQACTPPKPSAALLADDKIPLRLVRWHVILPRRSDEEAKSMS